MGYLLGQEDFIMANSIASEIGEQSVEHQIHDFVVQGNLQSRKDIYRPLGPDTLAEKIISLNDFDLKRQQELIGMR